MSDLKKIPDFKNPEEEAKFWDEHDSADYVDWSKADKVIFPNIKVSTESISLRLPSPLLARIKELANEKDVPYQSLMKVYLSEQVKRELKVLRK
jgi:predicted DNA binding CopG/RHH family protein